MASNKGRDLTGEMFGRLLVLYEDEPIYDKNGKKITMWKCECQCEDKTILSVRRSNLVGGNSKSCGCYFRERMVETNKANKTKRNKYDLTGEYGIGWTSNTNDEFYFDLEDYDKIKDYCWATKNGEGDYKRVVTNIDTNKNIPIHFIITGRKNIDHQNRNTFDNRKNNLRDATYQQNSQNKSLQHNNTSGVAGVYQRKNDGMWVARININKKQTNIGTFANKEEAVKARLKAEKEYYGEFAPQKHLYEKYGID